MSYNYKIIFKLLISISLVLFLVYFNLIDLNLFLKFDVNTIILILLLNYLIFFLASLRWHYILKIYNIHNNFLYVLKLNLISFFFGNFFIGQYGGDFIRGYYIYKKKPENKINAILSIFFDRIFGLVSLFFIISFLILFTHLEFFLGLVYFIIICTTILLIVLFLLSRIHKLNYILEECKKLFLFFINNTNKSVFIFIISLVQFMLIIAVVLIIFDKIYQNHNLINIALSASLAFLVNSLPITPGGIGLGESSFQVFSTLITNLDLQFATIFLINRIFYFISSLIGGFIYVNYKN